MRDFGPLSPSPSCSKPRCEVKPNEARDQITVTFGTGEVTGVFTEDVVCVVDGAANGGPTEETSLKTLSTRIKEMKLFLFNL